ncbi:tyrosine-type recombinase/integrase [Demequina sediminis]|uniref:tyrosine-type recombinase/integrase n=1 Tax=Demequina sediminis TaxID=1930058 RepID=UPI003305E28F
MPSSKRLFRRALARSSATFATPRSCASWLRRGSERGVRRDRPRRSGPHGGHCSCPERQGGKGRVVPIGPQTVQALDRYRRRRAGHALAGLPSLWLGERKRGFTYDALHKALEGRAKAAGIAGFHPHKLRHTAAHRWLAAGGSEGGLMAVAGWTRPDMLQRYTKARAAERAAVESRSLNLGDI